ncbi:T-box transcription factor TBX6L [Triplophysa dalaica]|uniref:T-box transcription factor TBX6L n=1 Tax=Triplophysa dalaica TaxID=1582913 RepID=UPI0024DF8731|nr:T-box transcription factor TBX6L [Triplophysa dalaica]
MYLPEEKLVLDLPYQINPLATNYGYYSQDLKEPFCRSQHGTNNRTNSVEAELTSLPVHVSLQCRELWDKFGSIGTEMLITKSGRRMFPSCKVTVTGLNPTVKYMVIMDMVPFDNHKYKWNKDQWEINGSADPHLPNRFFIHPDSPASGEKWMQYPISFHKLKLTNNTLNSSGLVVLHSMHKYLPRLHIVQSPDPSNPHMYGGYLRFTFPEAAFIAVTAYQNQEITKLKIDNNPFAKGFRDSGLNRKRFRDKETCDSDQQVNQNLTQNEQVTRLQEDEQADGTVSSSVDQSSSANSSDTASAYMTNPFISAFINTSDGGVPSPHQTHTILNLCNINLNSPNEVGPSILHNLRTAPPMSQSSPTVEINLLNRLPSHISSPLIPQYHHHSPISQTPCRPMIHPIPTKNQQPYFGTPPHHYRQCPDMELPLSLPPKLSRIQLPESALKNLEMTASSSFVHMRPLTNILNRIQAQALSSGTSENVLQNLSQHEQYLRETEREPHPHIYPDVQEFIGQQFALNSMMVQQARDSQNEDRSHINYPNARPFVDYYCNQNTAK